MKLKHYGRVEWMGVKYSWVSPQQAARRLEQWKLQQATEEFRKMLMKIPALKQPPILLDPSV